VIALILTLVVIGFCLWLLTTFVPMEPRIKQLVVGLVAFICVVYVLLTLLHVLPTMQVIR
jgi:hypothetical protein